MSEEPPTAQALLHDRPLVLLDFDGPLTRLLPGAEFRRVTAGALDVAVSRGVVPDAELVRERDHVQLLRLLAVRDPDAARAAEAWCTAQEVRAAAAARLTPAADEFVAAYHRRGVALAVVTNNAPRAVTAVLAHGSSLLAALPVYGREPAAPERLKPAPHLLLAAARDAGVAPHEAVMVGDSVSDVRAARAATMPCVGLSPDPQRRRELLAAGAGATATDLAALVPPPS